MIEEFLIRHPKVADVQIAGLLDTFFGDVALAVIRPTEGMAIAEQKLRDFCASQVTHQ